MVAVVSFIQCRSVRVSPWKIAALIASFAVAIAAVGAGGFYLGSHYRLVPVDSLARENAAALPTPASLGLPAPPSPTPTTAAAPAALPKALGPFSYRFTPGETLGYALEARIAGNGSERDLGLGDIGLAMKAQFDMATTRVDPQGLADLTLRFTGVDMDGNFMGDKVTLHQGADRASMDMPGQRDAQQTTQDQLNAMPQMQFFREPIAMSIAPDGRVLSATGMPGFEKVLAPEQIVAAVGFPEQDMAPGTQWESSFNLPIPGLQEVVPARAVNTFERYMDLAGHKCAVIKQSIVSSGTNNVMSSTASALSGAMNISMPVFKLDGESYVYFDTVIGKVRQADMDLNLTMELGEEMNAVKQIIGLYGEALNMLDGKKPEATPKPQEPLMDLGVRIQSSLTLQDGFISQPQ